MYRSGIDELRSHYGAQFEVELKPNLADGKPLAVRMQFTLPIHMLSLGRSLPIPIGEKADGDARADNYEYMRRLVARSIIAIRECVSEDRTTWTSEWTPVRCVFDRPVNGKTNPREIHIDEIDKPMSDNITKCWNAFLANTEAAGKLTGIEDDTFRGLPGGGPGSGGGNGQDVRPLAPRDPDRPPRRTRE